MEYKEEVILGKTKGPKVAFIGCTHGNEPVGRFVIEELRRKRIKKGALSLILANPKALNKEKRFHKKDLNRSFPGSRDGEYEERLAFFLKERLKDFDYVFDLHGSKTDCGRLVVVTKMNRKTKDMLKLTSIPNILHIKNSVYGEVGLISHCNGIALEYGPYKDGRNYKVALKDVVEILTNLGMVDGVKNKIFPEKDLYIAKEKYIFNDFVNVSTEGMKDYKYIKRGDLIAHKKGKPIYSKTSFYPIFLQKGKTKNFALITSKKKYTHKFD